MQAVEADITGAFWDNTDGVGTGAAFVHVQGVVPPIEGVVSTTPGAMYPTPSATAVLCNGTNKPVTAKLLPWNETHVILASDEASRPRTVQSATKGGSLTLQGDQRPWIERMTSLLAHAQQTPGEGTQLVCVIDMPRHGEVHLVKSYLDEHKDALNDAFHASTGHVLLVNAVCGDTQFMRWDDGGVHYSTESVRNKIMTKMASFSDSYYTTFADAVECLFGTARIGSDYAHCWLHLPFDHESVKSVMPYGTSSAGVDHASVTYSRAQGMTFKAKTGNFSIAIVLEATSQIKEAIKCVAQDPHVDIMMELLAARNDRQIGYPYRAFLKASATINASSNLFVKMMFVTAEQRKMELDRVDGMVSYMQPAGARTQYKTMLARHASVGAS